MGKKGTKIMSKCEEMKICVYFKQPKEYLKILRNIKKVQYTSHNMMLSDIWELRVWFYVSFLPYLCQPRIKVKRNYQKKSTIVPISFPLGGLYIFKTSKLENLKEKSKEIFLLFKGSVMYGNK